MEKDIALFSGSKKSMPRNGFEYSGTLKFVLKLIYTTDITCYERDDGVPNAFAIWQLNGSKICSMI